MLSSNFGLKKILIVRYGSGSFEHHSITAQFIDKYQHVRYCTGLFQENMRD
jgi:hypothetical protein